MNKMDLIDYAEEVYAKIRQEYRSFLSQINIHPQAFVPVSARQGDFIAAKSEKIPWYKGLTVLEHLDAFEKESGQTDKPLRFPVQAIYKFTAENDDRRIVAGTVETGVVSLQDKVVFLPSRKQSRIKTIESFHTPVFTSVSAGYATGFTLTEQIYLQPGEIMCKISEPLPIVSTRFKANIFWMGKAPMIMGKKYKLKIATARTSVKLVEIINVLDASELTPVKNKQQIDRHDVAECVLETLKPIAFDAASDIESTGRFVIVDNYEITGGGTIIHNVTDGMSTLESHIQHRESQWEKSAILAHDRAGKFNHRPKFIVLTGLQGVGKRSIAKALEKKLFTENYLAYYLGLSSLIGGLDADVTNVFDDKEERLRRLGELARILTDTGHIFITTLSLADDYDLAILSKLNEPNEILVVNVGESLFTEFQPHMQLKEHEDIELAVQKIYGLLQRKDILPDYCI